VRDFTKLLVWQKAHSLVLTISAASVRFPRERAALAGQMRRAAESIATNIVEGSARRSQAEFARFLQISIASCSELEYQLQLARDYEVLAMESWQRLSAQTVEIRRMAIGLVRTIRHDLAAGRVRGGELKPNG
jgi:four helix bundle protein